MKKILMGFVAVPALMVACGVGAAIMAGVGEVSDVTVSEEGVKVAVNTAVPNTPIPPTRTPRPIATSTPVYDADCQTLEFFEYGIKEVMGRTPNFVPTDIGVWDLVWLIEDNNGSYSILLTEVGGCLEQAASVSVFDLDYGDPELAGELQGTVTGFFSEADDGLDWFIDEVNSSCAVAYYTTYSNSQKMSDGTLWEIMCGVEGDMFTIALSIYPKGW